MLGAAGGGHWLLVGSWPLPGAVIDRRKSHAGSAWLQPGIRASIRASKIVEPALEHLGPRVVRADSIDKPGTITKQIMEYLLRSRLVIADLSFHNPNVFYELAIRHAARLPVVQLIRASERIPFDLNQIRTIRIDTSDIYTLVPRIDIYRAEIGNQVRRALEDPDSVDNPVTTYFPDLKVQL